VGLPFAVINTDQKELDACQASIKVQIGMKWLNGHGASVPPLGAEAALGARIEIGKVCRGPVVLIAALGGGTGTGAGPVVERIARAHGCDVTAVVTMPLRWEGRWRTRQAVKGLARFDTDKLVTVWLDDLIGEDRQMSLRQAFEIANVEVARAVLNISEEAMYAPRRGLTNGYTSTS
jgi:cell division protein FtsZ